jgi:hypothetical protein
VARHRYAGPAFAGLAGLLEESRPRMRRVRSTITTYTYCSLSRISVIIIG